MNDTPAFQFQSAIRKAWSECALIRLVLSSPLDKNGDLVKIIARPVTIKKTEHLSFTYRHKTRDIVKNYAGDAIVSALDESLGKFRNAVLFTDAFDLEFPSLKQRPSTQSKEDNTAHDRSKKRHVETSGKTYLTSLGITDERGNITKSAQDKYRQIDKYTEILSRLIAQVPEKPVLNIADMGAGKGYLTFALADYLQEKGYRNAKVTGIESRKDLVDLCNNIAQQNKFENLSFVQGLIATYDGRPDVLIALHACDTATDDALHKGIAASADLIVVAPCCHKQVRRDMQVSKASPLEPVVRHGIFLERQAEMLTDTVRALILEYFGYAVTVAEFISLEHTAKNVLITAQKRPKPPSSEVKEKILARIKSLKELYGLGTHYLERLTGIAGQSRQ